MIQNLAAGQRVMTSNVFLVDGARTVLVDVGSQFDVVEEIHQYVEEIDAVVLTHTHHDHVENLPAVVEAFDTDVWGYDPEFDGVDHVIEDGSAVELGDHEYVALHTPGHKDDHLCLYSDENEVLFAGDLIFANGGFGRTDLAEGNRSVLIDSIQRVLNVVGEDLEALHSGHGPSITTNPYHHVELALRAARM